MNRKHAVLELDELDIRIVMALEADARQSARSLAPKFNTTPTTVQRRLQRLLEARAIKIITVTDPESLGFRTRAVIGINTRPGKQDNAAECLLSLPNTQYMWLTMGRYDMMVYTVFRDMHELVSFVDQKLSCIPDLTHIEELLILEEAKDSWMHLTGPVGAVGKAVPRKVDESDRQLIRELELCPRESITNLSSKLRMSTKAVRRKLQTLIDDNIVRIFSVVNPSTFGFGIQAAIFVRVCNGNIVSAVNTLAENKKILHMLMITGPFKILLHGNFRDMEELTLFLKNDLANIPGVLSQETSIMTRAHAAFGLLTRGGYVP
ncbi:MAG: Lrp/AsnC family transcriptional regulator [Dehalococcoidia bacterium]|nr:Lrp/AsnC family transcriptional regulator [Dehalococcoidia bacterium]